MRRLTCLAAAGLLALSLTGPLSGTAAASPPPREPDRTTDGPSRPEPPTGGPFRPAPPYPGEVVPIVPGPVRPIGVRPPSRARAFVLTFARGESPTPVTRHVLLTCDPPKGTHLDPVGACGALVSAKGDPGSLAPLSGVVCTMRYDPVTVTATGTWDGRFVRFVRTYGSGCSLYAATGAVFSFGERSPR
ncbi:SSI family serine proteinase inhibitor [Streptosporangium saharense]|uniref:SSI family serine proteinase inhibitor n=1 Tax=Streptosporangium saharense TaxID=1706840 RepID=UPI00332F3E78